MSRLANADMLANATLGIGKFQDKRAWVKPGDAQSESFIASQGAWKFGVSSKGTDYVPVKTLVQDLFVAEFTKAGVPAKAIDQVLPGQDRKALVGAGEQHRTEYVLGGDILVLEFANDAGFVTVTSRRTVTLALVLARTRGADVVLESTFSEAQSEGEGMGVMHSTNLDKLMNRVFRKVVSQVVEQVAAKMVMRPDDIRVVIAYR
jgi:hypothetical protein